MGNDSKPKTLCVLPWIHSFVNNNGNYQICCTSEEYHTAILDLEKKSFNVKDQPDIDQVMNSTYMNELRLNMLQGQWNHQCKRCQLTEKNGGISRRLLENSQFKNLIPTLVEQTEKNGSLKNLNFKILDYRLGNLCNLQCRMCSPHATKKWLKEWNEIKPPKEHISEEKKNELNSLNWMEEDYLIEEFSKKSQLIERLHFAGGEPFISKKMKDILEFCVANNLSQNIELSYNTNITVLDLSVLNLWKKFKGVKIMCSVDGIGKVNDYIRMPSKWEVIDQNLMYLDKYYQELNIKEILLSTTVQIYNVLELVPLYEYVRKFKNVVKAVNLNILYYPNYLQANVLPQKYLEKVEKELLVLSKRLQLDFPDLPDQFIKNIDELISFMKEENLSSLLPIFMKVNLDIDRTRELKLKESIPSLYKVVAREFL